MFSIAYKASPRDIRDAGRLLAVQSARGNRDADRLAAALTAAGIEFAGRRHPYRGITAMLLLTAAVGALVALYALTSTATFWHVLAETYAALVILAAAVAVVCGVFARPAQEATGRHVERALADGNAQWHRR